MIRSRLAHEVLRRYMGRIRRGDPSALLRLDHPDIRFSFPGTSSWAGEIHGKPALEAWLRRFCDAGLQIYPDEVVMTGPPWRTTLCICGTDHLDDPDGTRVYDNRYVIWGTIRWGRLREYEVYEDTEKSLALDAFCRSASRPRNGARSAACAHPARRAPPGR